MKRGAEISDDGRYRYRLWRTWGDGPHVTFIMLNPSTADAEVDDPTVRKCIGLAKTWGCYGGIGIVNLYARRTSSPDELFGFEDDIVGPENDDAIGHMIDVPPLGPVICAWGMWGVRGTRAGEVYDRLRADGVEPKCLGPLTQQGQPRHPLYLPESTTVMRAFFGRGLTRCGRSDDHP